MGIAIFGEGFAETMAWISSGKIRTPPSLHYLLLWTEQRLNLTFLAKWGDGESPPLREAIEKKTTVSEEAAWHSTSTQQVLSIKSSKTPCNASRHRVEALLLPLFQKAGSESSLLWILLTTSTPDPASSSTFLHYCWCLRPLLPGQGLLLRERHGEKLRVW